MKINNLIIYKDIGEMKLSNVLSVYSTIQMCCHIYLSIKHITQNGGDSYNGILKELLRIVLKCVNSLEDYNCGMADMVIGDNNLQDNALILRKYTEAFGKPIQMYDFNKNLDVQSITDCFLSLISEDCMSGDILDNYIDSGYDYSEPYIFNILKLSEQICHTKIKTSA